MTDITALDSSHQPRLDRTILGSVALVALLLALGHPVVARAQSAPADTDWPTYGGDLANRRYAPLDQIDGDNFDDLEIAWRFGVASLGPRVETNLQVTPLKVGNRLYLTAGSRRAAVALDAETGELLWMHRLDEGKRGEVAPRRLSGRGLAYWDDGGTGRVLYVTPGYRLIALDAATGVRIPTFGVNGIVDLKTGLDQEIDPVVGEIGLHAAPIVADGIIVIGAAHLPGGAPKTISNVKGYIRGYDVMTGERRWIFHTIPEPGEFGHETWLNDSWRNTGNTGVWSQMSIDEELGMVYMGVEMPTNDYYGGHHPGDNLFSDSIVALDLQTGTRVWHYQTVHHDVWDFDLPAAPMLVDITVDDRDIKAVATPTKQSWLYVLDRETGTPVWPIEERPVAASDVPGERLSPTQPHPTKPPAHDQQGVSIDDLIDFTPGLRAEALEIVKRYRLGPLFAPPSVATADGTLGTLITPQSTGGANWPGGSFDAETDMFYVYSKTQVSAYGLVNDPERSEQDFIRGRPEGVDPGATSLSVQGLPLLRPPWGRITAIDLTRGELAWQVAHGETPDSVRNHPALADLEIPRTGRPGVIGTLVTRTLVIAGEAGTFTLPSGEEGAMLRAYAKDTGEELGAVYMPGGQTGSPMTYMLDGNQFIVVAVGRREGAELLAYRLP